MSTKNRNLKLHSIRTGISMAVLCILAWGCTSAKPKKDEHALADILLGHPQAPAIGIPDAGDSAMTEEKVSNLTPTVSDDVLAQDRDADRRRDQESYEAALGSFRSRFSNIKTSGDQAESGPSVLRQQRLEQVSSSIQTLRGELARYGQSPGNLFFYNEGDERQGVLQQRSDEISRLDHEWADYLAGVEERLSDIRATEALQRLRESVRPDDSMDRSSAPGAMKGLKN